MASKLASKPSHHKPAPHRAAVKLAGAKSNGVLLAQAQQTKRTQPPIAYYALMCQPNSTFYISRHQDIPYAAAAKLARYLETQWGSMMPPLFTTDFNRADAEKKYNASSAKEIYEAVVSIWQHALPGNTNSGDTGRLTYIHNIIGGLFMAGNIDGNQVTLLKDDFDTADRKAARVAFNTRAVEYGVPVAMYISGMKLPVEGIGNFEGFCFKAALKP